MDFPFSELSNLEHVLHMACTRLASALYIVYQWGREGGSAPILGLFNHLSPLIINIVRVLCLYVHISGIYRGKFQFLGWWQFAMYAVNQTTLCLGKGFYLRDGYDLSPLTS